MTKKLSLLLLLILCFFAMVGCKKEKTVYDVTYKSVTVTEVEPAEDAPEGTESTYTYEVKDQGTEKVEEGSKITGVAVNADGTKYLADKYYTAQEVNLDETAVYNAEEGVTANLTLYAEDKSYAVFQELAVGEGYTLNYATTVFPTTWNSHIYETETDSTILGYASTGFYEFDYNETKDGYKWVDGMAVGDPKDVTADYVGEDWGIAEGEVARAWEITIRNDLCWDDGTPINADSFVESAKRLLNPLAQNSRADDYCYSGNLVVHNAENYVLQGSIIDQPYGKFYATAQEAIAAGYKVSLDLATCNTTFEVDWIGASLETLMKTPAYYEAYIVGYFSIYEGEAGARTKVVDENGKPVTFFDKYNVVTAEGNKIEWTEQMRTDYSNCDDWNPNADAELGLLCTAPIPYAEMSFDKVGIKKVADNKIVFIIDKELSGFYLKYSLSAYLVKTDVYDACDNLDADGKLPEGEAYRSTYCTDATNSPSYGPYKLTEYQLNKYFKLEKNTNWWAYKDEANKNLYQTTAIVYTMAESAATRLQMFLSGKFDSYGLSSDDMKDYQSSDYTYFTDGDSTWFIMFNPDLEAFGEAEWEHDAAGARTTHKNIDKEIISIKEFRQAISFALNRAEYQLACDPTGNVAKALFSPMIISDPENGTVYRNTDEAKKAIVKFWGLENQIGADKLYKTVDDAIDSITGYNLTMAKSFFNTAYDKAVEAGYIDNDDVVEVLIGTPNLTSNYYNKGYDYLVNCYTEAVKGTKLEGKLTFKRDGTLGNAFGDALRNNKVDMLFGCGWTGSALDPYGLIEVYTTYDNRYNASRDFSVIYADVELPRKYVESEFTGSDTEMAVYSASVADWTKSLGGDTITVSKKTGEEIETFECSFGTTVDYGTRGIVLAAIELAALNEYDAIPIAYDSSAALKSMKIKFYTEEYVYGVGRGGIKYTTFLYNDSEWAAFVAQNGGKLNYKASAE